MEVSDSMVPTPPARSTRGCWTCRLRKKKCDEVFPGCLRCASVNIDCIYGPRPEWIDNTNLGKQELERIKKIVGASASRKRAAHRVKSRAAAHSPSTGNAGSPSQDQTENGRSGGSSSLRVHRPNGTSSGTGSSIRHQSKWVEDNEASLMMHYLDHVFFIQFRFYTPSVTEGGRGWLLSLLTQTKPLYHAALSLSACLAQEAGEAETDYLQELERHHQLTLRELQLFIQDHSDHASPAFGSNIQILACMVQLISFELFHGGISKWQVHLRAACELVILLHDSSEASKKSAVVHESAVSFERLASEAALTVQLPVGSAGLKFFTAVILWFDALACISTGKRPYLYQHYDHLLRKDNDKSIGGICGKIQLHEVMGCQNWAIEAIGSIAALKALKDDQILAGTFAIHQVAEISLTIQSELNSQSSQVFEEVNHIRDLHSGSPPHHLMHLYNRYTTLVVTRIFACAALIYLQTVITSDPSTLYVSAALSSALEAMTFVPDPRMFRGLVWPLCVAGCMASSPSHQQFFRDTIKDAICDSPRFGNSNQVVQILEKSWEMQRERGRLIDCATIIQEMGVCVLLV